MVLESPRSVDLPLLGIATVTECLVAQPGSHRFGRSYGNHSFPGCWAKCLMTRRLARV